MRFADFLAPAKSWALSETPEFDGVSRRMSVEIFGRPRCRSDFQRLMRSRKPARCQRITVSGCIVFSASRHFGSQTIDTKRFEIADGHHPFQRSTTQQIEWVTKERISACNAASARLLGYRTRDQRAETDHKGDADFVGAGNILTKTLVALGHAVSWTSTRPVRSDLTMPMTSTTQSMRINERI